MNERQFIKKLNKKDNKQCGFTYVHLLHLIEDNRTNLPAKKSMFFHFRKKTASEIINNHLELILKKTMPMQLEDVMKLLLKNRDTAEVIKKNLDLVINRITEIGKTNKATLFCTSSHIIKSLNNFFGKEFIEENINKLVKIIPMEYFAHEMKCLKHISDKVDNKVNKYINDNIEEFINGMLDTYKIQTITNEQRKYIKNLETLSVDEKEELIRRHTQTLLEIIKEIIPKKNGHELWNTIEYINGGAYSDVYRVGDRVIKIGDVRATYHIPNHTRILQPIARFEMYLNDDNKIPYGCIEVMERVRELKSEECNDEKFYELYKDLRKDGIVFSDFRASNIGVLLTENSPEHIINGEKINVVPQSVGFMNEMKGAKRKPGDLVILDTDFLYNENDNNITWQHNGFSKKFEKRWQAERQSLISKTLREQVIKNDEEEIDDDIIK